MIMIIVLLLYKKFHKIILPLDNFQPFENVWSNTNKYGLSYKNVMENMLMTISEKLQQNNIEIIPVYGTLLGMVRHNGTMIPWDDDVDICVRKDYFKNILELKDYFASKGIGIAEVNGWGSYFLKFYDLTEPLIENRKWSWPFIDVFSWEQKGDKILISDAGKPYINEINRTDFFPLKSNKFNNIILSLPKNPDKFLSLIYGKDWDTVCVSTLYNHRKEHPFKKSFSVKCTELTKKIEINNLFKNVWVINLKSRPDRWNQSKERLELIGINPNRWDAIDATSDEFLDFYNNIPSPKRSKGEVACYMSHLSLWKYLYNNNIDFALIFEDDLILTNINKDDIRNHVEKSLGFNIIYLGHCFSSEPLFSTPMTKIGTAQCLHSYVVSKHGLEKLLNLNINYGIPIDKITEDFCKQNVCYIAHHKQINKNTFGHGIVHQDMELGSNILYKTIM
jgi:hypothetical protein